MSEFIIFTKLGFSHISNIRSFDHILFIVALCSIYSFKDWKQVLLLVSAFTLGHSITLALASLQLIYIDSQLIEFIIPITILITCVANFFYKFPRTIKPIRTKKKYLRYIMATFFGLIHGLGFSNYLRSLLGKEDSLLTQLFSFNLGLEIGQIMIVFLLLSLHLVLLNYFRVKHASWNLILSGIAFGMALMLLIQNGEFV